MSKYIPDFGTYKICCVCGKKLKLGTGGLTMPKYIEFEKIFPIRFDMNKPEESLEELVNHIFSIPSADVEEVVRCEDCKFLQYGECRVLGIKAGGCFYCYLGERKEE